MTVGNSSGEALRLDDLTSRVPFITEVREDNGE